MECLAEYIKAGFNEDETIQFIISGSGCLGNSRDVLILVVEVSRPIFSLLLKVISR